MIEANALVEIDYTGATVLAELIGRLRERGVDVAVARLESVRAQESFARLGLFGADRPRPCVSAACRRRSTRWAGRALVDARTRTAILPPIKWRYDVSKPLIGVASRRRRSRLED